MRVLRSLASDTSCRRQCRQSDCHSPSGSLDASADKWPAAEMKICKVTVERNSQLQRHQWLTTGDDRSLRDKIIIIIITMTMFMVLSSWQSHCESSPGSFDECRMAPSGRWPKTKPDDLGCESACTGCQKLHPPSLFIITQPESWYSFYRPTEGRRLSRPSWLVTYRDGLPIHRQSPIRVLTGSDVAQLIEANALPLSQTANCYH